MDIVNDGGSSGAGGAGGGSGGRSGARGGGAVLFDANTASLQHNMQALSIDDEPSPGWSQLRTDVAG